MTTQSLLYYNLIGKKDINHQICSIRSTSYPLVCKDCFEMHQRAVWLLWLKCTEPDTHSQQEKYYFVWLWDVLLQWNTLSCHIESRWLSRLALMLLSKWERFLGLPPLLHCIGVAARGAVAPPARGTTPRKSMSTGNSAWWRKCAGIHTEWVTIVQ